MSDRDDDSLLRLRQLIEQRWLPAFVAANPGTRVDAYQEVPKAGPPLLPEEAAGFLRALDEGVLRMVSDEEGRETGLCRLPGYRAYYCYTVIGRPANSLPDVQLWREWLTHVAVAARLHLDYGYPKLSLAIEEDAFDIVVHGSHNEAFIAVEVKKRKLELDSMVARMHELSEQDFDPACGEKLGNWDKKYRGLLGLRVPIFWAVSPVNEYLFDVTYDEDPPRARFNERAELPRFGERA
jgi:hypothetical protein